MVLPCEMGYCSIGYASSQITVMNYRFLPAQLNEKMDVIEQAWDDQIIQEQKAIANE